MTVSITGIISESNINIPNNTSDVTVTLSAIWNSGSWAADSPGGSITIDGTTYTFNANFNVGQSSSGSEVIKVQTKTVTHNSDGTKTVSCSASYDGTGSYTVTWSGSSDLSTIPRTSALADITAFNLEDSFSATITKYSESFTDKLEILLGTTVVKTVNPYTSGAGITLTDDELISIYRLMAENTGTFIFKLSTYSGATLIGYVSKNGTGTAKGTAQVNISGTWKRALPYINVGGVWKKAIMITKDTNWIRGKA